MEDGPWLKQWAYGEGVYLAATAMQAVSERKINGPNE
jgi:hypothetical protein